MVALAGELTMPGARQGLKYRFPIGTMRRRYRLPSPHGQTRQKAHEAAGAPAERSGGLATALLQHVVDWAAEQGAARISVDFETQNIDGARFWLRHFQPVAYSLLRQVDDRILWAHAEREESAYW